MQPMIEIKSVNKFYGKKQALKDVSLTMEQGMFGLLGRNGAGKTTLMKLLATLHGKQSGEITICGIPVEKSKEIRSIIGYLPQEFSMYPSMKVEECLDYLGVLSGMSRQERRERIPMLLKKVNLMEKRNSKVKSLSGGMKRRLGIAQALLHNPKVLIVDEPTAGLDPEERIRFRNLLCEVAEERIVLLSTHIVGDIEATCEQIAIMNEGEILWRGTVAELLQNASGKVFTALVNREQLAEIKKNYIVTSMLQQGMNTEVRFLMDAKKEMAGGLRQDEKRKKEWESKTAHGLSGNIDIVPVEPNCEDAYMYCLYEHGCAATGGEE